MNKGMNIAQLGPEGIYFLVIFRPAKQENLPTPLVGYQISKSIRIAIAGRKMQFLKYYKSFG